MVIIENRSCFLHFTYEAKQRKGTFRNFTSKGTENRKAKKINLANEAKKLDSWPPVGIRPAFIQSDYKYQEFDFY